MTAYIRRQFAGAAPKTTLTNGPYTSVATNMSISSATNWPTGSVGPFCATINRGNSTEEKILVASITGSTLTIAARGYDGTVAATHNSGETIEITNSAVDLDEANQAVVALLGSPTTVGDMISASGTNPTTFQRIAAGSSGQVLQGGTPPSWNANPSITSLTTAGVVTAGGIVTGTALKPTGLTGATQTSRVVGATASGAPVSGTFILGDMVVDQTGRLWVCTTAGTPGSWWPVGGQYPTQATVNTSETTASTTATDLATPGPAVTATIGPSGVALVTCSAEISNNTAADGAAAGVTVSGANTVAYQDYIYVTKVGTNSNALFYSRTRLFTGLTAGSTTFTNQYHAITGGTAAFQFRNIMVQVL